MEFRNPRNRSNNVQCGRRLPHCTIECYAGRLNLHSTVCQYASGQAEMSMVHLLLQHNADLDTQNKGNKTPLHAASTQGQARVAQLLEHRADVFAFECDRLGSDFARILYR